MAKILIVEDERAIAELLRAQHAALSMRSPPKPCWR